MLYIRKHGYTRIRTSHIPRTSALSSTRSTLPQSLHIPFNHLLHSHSIRTRRIPKRHRHSDIHAHRDYAQGRTQEVRTRTPLRTRHDPSTHTRRTSDQHPHRPTAQYSDTVRITPVRLPDGSQRPRYTRRRVYIVISSSSTLTRLAHFIHIVDRDSCVSFTLGIGWYAPIHLEATKYIVFALCTVAK